MSDDDKKKEDKDTIVFRGYDGKVKFAEFDKHMGRAMRRKYGTTLGDQFWKNGLPVLQGDDAMSHDEFMAHCEDVLYALADRNPARYKQLYDVGSGFWERGWHVVWRKQEFERMFDTVSSKCKGEALLSCEEHGMSEAPNIRAILKKEYGGAGEDIKLREDTFDLGMPKQAGAPAFPKGIDIVKKLRALNVERMDLSELCPPEDRDTYLHAQEKYMVKMIMRLLAGGEFDKPIKDLLLEIKFERKIERAGRPVQEDDLDEEDIDIEDWDYRNFKEGWVPTFKRLRSKLINFYKEKKFNQHGGDGPKNKLPSMLVKEMVEKHCASFLAPGFGQQPNTSGSNFPQDGRAKLSCWACGEKGHKRGDPLCKKDKNGAKRGSSFNSKRKFEEKGTKGSHSYPNKQGQEICQYYKETGKCRFGARCRRLHVDSGGVERRKPGQPTRNSSVNLAKTESKKKKAALKVAFHKNSNDYSETESDLDSIVKGFCMLSIRANPRSYQKTKEIDIPFFNTKLLQDDTFAYDTGSAEGISTYRDDFYSLDQSDVAKDSAIIKGPSVGTPMCEGRGVLIYMFEEKGVLMGLVHPHGIFAVTSNDDLDFRLASAMELKRHGIRMIGGAFKEPDIIECVRTKAQVTARNEHKIMVVRTKGKASDLKCSVEFDVYLRGVAQGKISPLFQVSWFDSSDPRPDEKRSAEMVATHPLRTFLCSTMNRKFISVNLMNEAKLSGIERSRLFCRRLAYCDTNMFRIMANKESFGNFPNLPALNEDNKYADMGKFKRLPYKKNDPENTMNCPPFWNVKVDGYGGQGSLGPASHEGAIGAYLFCCVSTGSVDCRLYASHKQFPIALHQFLVRVQAEYWKVRTIFVDTHSVNISADVEEVLALFQVKLMPVSAGTPQEMAFAESKVRIIKRMSTAMLLGAPHLPANSWALADKYAVLISDFLPVQTRQNECPYYLRTGKMVDWDLIKVKCFGAPCIYSPIDGPIHKRAPVAEEGFFVGRQWPFMIIKRKSDGKLLNVSDKKVRVYESMYTVPMNVDIDPRLTPNKSKKESNEDEGDKVNEAVPDIGLKHEVDNNMVASIKSLREHKLELPGRRQGDMSEIEESAMYGNGQIQNEGLYLDQVVQTDIDQLASIIAETTMRGTSLKDSILKAIRQLKPQNHQGELAKISSGQTSQHRKAPKSP